MTSFSGHVGSFRSKLEFPDNQWEIHYGAAVIATGAVEYQPTEYLYGATSPGDDPGGDGEPPGG